MEVKTVNKTLNLNNISINENIAKWVEQDIIVPDSKPDAVKIINVTVTPYVNNVEIMQDKVKVSGNINYFVIYKVNDQTFTTRGLFTSYPYSEILDIQSANSEMIAMINPICKNVIYSLPNERKISIKSEILFKVRLKKSQSISLINMFEGENKIECKMCKNQFCNIIQDKKSVIASKEDFMLPKDAEDFFELLNVESKICNTEFKESYNKVMLKGDIDIKMIYLSENQDESVKKLNYTLPFSAMVELDNITDSSKFDIDYVMEEFNLKLNPDITTTKTMTADFQIGVNVTMFENEDVEYVEDFYCQNRELNYDLDNINAVKKFSNFNKNIDIKENVSNILDENTRILDYKLDTNNINLEVMNNNLKLDGQAKVILLLQDLNTLELETKTIDIIVNESNEIENILSNSNIDIDIACENITVSQNGQDIEIKIQLKITGRVEDIASINVIGNILDEELDTSNLDSINIYIVKPQDTLWTIAKKYKTSVDKIVMTNNIADPEMIDVGQKILVIR